MQNNNQQDNSAAVKEESPGHGPQGVDKAPGEEPSEDNVQFTQQSQKGKKVDADVSKESGKPIEQGEDL